MDSTIYHSNTMYGLLAGVEHVVGDMFESVPSADVIFLKVSFLSLLPFSRKICFSLRE